VNTSIRLIMSTENSQVIENTVHRIKRSAGQRFAGKIVIEKCVTVNEPELLSVWVIMEHARQNAEILREATKADVGVGDAGGRAWVPFARGAQIAYFPFRAMVAVAEDGAIAWDIPAVFNASYENELRTLCFRKFRTFPLSSASTHVRAAGRIAVHEWSKAYDQEVSVVIRRLD
jgi:hypothetical protein